MPRKAPSIIEERRNTHGDFERKLMKEEMRSIKFKNYAEGTDALLKPVVIGAVGYGVFRGMKYIAQGISGFELDIFGVGDWWDRRASAGTLNAQDTTGIGGDKAGAEFYRYLMGVLVHTDEVKEDKSRYKYWWE